MQWKSSPCAEKVQADSTHLRFATPWQARSHTVGFCKPCASNPPVLSCIHSTTPPTLNRTLHFPFAPLHLQNLCPAFSFLRESQKEKANIKSFGKGWRGCRGGRKEPFPKGFSFPPAGKVPPKKNKSVVV